MSGATKARVASCGSGRWCRRATKVVAAGALVAVTALGVTPASGGVDGPSLSIDPTSGPIGTVITATITGCIGANADGTARVDFAFSGFTPSNSVLFTPDAGGNAVVELQALDKEGQTEGLTDADVILSQCEGEPVQPESVGAAQVAEPVVADFTVIRQAAPTAPAEIAPPPVAVEAGPAFTG